MEVERSIAAVMPQKAKLVIGVGVEEGCHGVTRKPTGKKVGLVATMLCQDDSC